MDTTTDPAYVDIWQRPNISSKQLVALKGRLRRAHLALIRISSLASAEIASGTVTSRSAIHPIASEATEALQAIESGQPDM